ncbi:hypothetical protein [Novipirellula artificiosorum]|uniref:Uncharacterized protein n=1 Tax=Novipirellula artificiosorum TaxID=2528016 RepID=A0A5C6DMN0_9BACT|nr:hypothetical protein [Novipirellula artificiosorum]TWU36119.1 hypothetical protein Poly41_38720 [Novipirellula artificiosorum]
MKMTIKSIVTIGWNNSAIVAAVVLLGIVSAAVAEERASTDLKNDVLEWIDQLDSPSVSKRAAAEQALIEAGPEALPFLPETKQGMSIEASERLARVRSSLRSTRAETNSDAITVRLDGASTLGDALEAISRDSGIEFEYPGDQSIPIEAVATPLSFWHAVDYVLDQADLDINFYGGDRDTLQLQKREEDRPSRVDSAAYTGVYRIEPTSVTSRRVLNHPNLSALNISMEISWEPRLTPIGMSIPVTQLRGKLDDGAMLKPQESGETIDIATHSDISFSEFYLPMQLPAGQPESIESLSGVIHALLPGQRQTFELPLSDSAANKKIDAMEVKVESIRKNGPLHEIRIAVTLEEAGRSLESHRQWIFENKAFVRRPDGSHAEHLGYEVFRQSTDGAGIGYLFDLGDSARESIFVYESPTAVAESEVSFVLQDIPLP